MKKLLALFLSALVLLSPLESLAVVNGFVQLRRGQAISAGGGSTPSFGAEVMTYSNDTSGTSDTITLSSGISSGNRAVLLIRIFDETATLSSISDSKGNTWTVDASVRTQKPTGKTLGVVASAHLTTTLATSDTITLTWASVAAYSQRRVTLNYLSNCASSGQPDVATTNSTGSQTNSPSVSGTTTSTNTVTIGMIFENQNVDTASSEAWTRISSQSESSMIVWNYRTTFSSSGSKTMSSTLSDTAYWGALFCAYK